MPEYFTQTRGTGGNATATTVSTGRSIGGTSLAVDSLSNWSPTTGNKVHFITYKKNSDGTKNKSTQCDWSAIIPATGTTLTSLTLLNGTDAGNDVDDFVEMTPTASWGEDLYNGLVAEHKVDGKHSDITADSVTINSGGAFTGNGSVGSEAIADGAITIDKFDTGAATASVATSETTTSTSYTDLTTTTDTVTVTIGANGLALVCLSARVKNDTAAAQNAVSVAVSGANTIAASDTNALFLQIYNANVVLQLGTTILFTGLTSGSTTFKMKYRVNSGGSGSGTGTFSNRNITVIPL